MGQPRGILTPEEQARIIERRHYFRNLTCQSGARLPAGPSADVCHIPLSRGPRPVALFTLIEIQ